MAPEDHRRQKWSRLATTCGRFVATPERGRPRADLLFGEWRYRSAVARPVARCVPTRRFRLAQSSCWSIQSRFNLRSSREQLDVARALGARLVRRSKPPTRMAHGRQCARIRDQARIRREVVDQSGANRRRSVFPRHTSCGKCCTNGRVRHREHGRQPAMPLDRCCESGVRPHSPDNDSVARVRHRYI